MSFNFNQIKIDLFVAVFEVSQGTKIKIDIVYCFFFKTWFIDSQCIFLFAGSTKKV